MNYIIIKNYSSWTEMIDTAFKLFLFKNRHLKLYLFTKEKHYFPENITAGKLLSLKRNTSNHFPYNCALIKSITFEYEKP